jgi:osmotically-inducible protein OsmY
MRDAERAAHNAPGVTEVNNLLAIDSGVYAGVM